MLPSLRRKQQPVHVRVSSSHTVKHPPEYCHLIFRICHTGATPTAVNEGVKRTRDEVTTLLRELSAQVEDESEDVMDVPSASRPQRQDEVDIHSHANISWTAAGAAVDKAAIVEKMMAPVVMIMHREGGTVRRLPEDGEGFRGETSVLGTFQDWRCLDGVVRCLTSNQNVTVSRLDWVVSTTTRRTLETRAADGAMRDARMKAIDLLIPYTSRVNLHPVKITADRSESSANTPEKHERGEGDDHDNEGGKVSVYIDDRLSRVVDPAEEGEYWLAPQQVVVRCGVKVEFAAT